MSDSFLDPLDPENSPIEKLIVQRRFRQERRFRDYLEAQGLDPELASKMGAAMDRWEQDKDFDYQEHLRELEGWANIHTHPGTYGIDSGAVPGTAWVAVGEFGGVWYSPDDDAETWVYQGRVLPDTAHCITWDGSRYVVGDINGDVHELNEEGTADTLLATDIGGEGKQLSGIIWIDELQIYLVSVARISSTDSNLLWSEDAETWNLCTGSPPEGYNTRWTFTFDEEAEIVYCSAGDAGTSLIDDIFFSSTDGKEWTEEDPAESPSSLNMLEYCGSYFMSKSGEGDGIAITTDLEEWDHPSVSAGPSITGVSRVDGRAVYGNGSDIYYSTVDGLSWALAALSNTKTIRHFFYNGNAWVAVGLDNTILVSTALEAGESWTLVQPEGTTNNIEAVSSNSFAYPLQGV